MASPYTLYNMLRCHDQAIYDWLEGCKVDYGVVAGVPRPHMGILRVYTAPQRAFAVMQKVLVRKGWLPTPYSVHTPAPETLVINDIYETPNHVRMIVQFTDTDPNNHKMGLSDPKQPVIGLWTRIQGTGPIKIDVDSVISTPDQVVEKYQYDYYANAPLPFASIYRGEEYPDLSRANTMARTIMGRRVQDNFDATYHRWPTPWAIPYQIDFWTLKQYTSNYIKEWFYSHIGRVGSAPNEVMLEVNHGGVWGVKLAAFKVTTFSDMSEIEGVANGQRLFRYGVRGILNGRCFMPPEETRRIILFSQLQLAVRTQSLGQPPADTVDGTIIKNFNLIQHGNLALNSLHTEGTHIKSVPLEAYGYPYPITLDSWEPTQTFKMSFKDTESAIGTGALPAYAGPLSIEGDLFFNTGSPSLNIELVDRYAKHVSSVQVPCTEEGWCQFSRVVNVPPEVSGLHPAGAALVLSLGSNQNCVLGHFVVKDQSRFVGSTNYWIAGNQDLLLDAGISATIPIPMLPGGQYILLAQLTSTGVFSIVSTVSPAPLGSQLVTVKPGDTTLALIVLGGSTAITVTNTGIAPAELTLSNIVLSTLQASLRSNAALD